MMQTVETAPSAVGFQWGIFSPKSLHSIRHSNRRINLWHGAVRSSKTVSSQVRWLKFINEAPPGGQLLMVGVTIGTLKDNILDPIAEMVGPENYHYSAGSREAHICGRRILIRGANDEAAEKKIRGLTLSGVYGDELTLWPETFFKRCLDRLSVPGAKLFGTTNPDSPYHWLKTEYLDRESELDLAAFHFELDDNPNLPTHYLENIKREFTGLWYKRFIQGLWVVAEGAAFDQFDPDLHCISDWSQVPNWNRPERPPFEKTIVGIDYGTSNPTAFIALGLFEGVWYAFAEYRHEGSKARRQHTDGEHSEALQQFLFEQQIVPNSIQLDPSAASFRAQLRSDGVRRVRPADNEVLDGIRVVSHGLTSGKLVIHVSCQGLIKDCNTYAWDPDKQEKGEDVPLKKNDHSIDGCRYAAIAAIGRPSTRNLPKPKAA